MGALVERHRLAVRSECFKTHAAARARRGLVRIFALTRMAAHWCARLSPLQAWRSIFCASLQPIKGSILAYVSSCTRCRAARRAPPPLGGARSRTGGGRARRPRETSRTGRVHVACGASGAAKAMRGRRVHVMNCLEPAWSRQQSLKRPPTFTLQRFWGQMPNRKCVGGETMGVR